MWDSIYFEQFREIGVIIAAMKSAVFVILLIMVAALGSHAQDSTVCPTVQVTGPAGIHGPGEPVKFTADVKGAGLREVEHKWKVSQGKIVDGQGTNAITMVYDRDANGTSITATVEVSGLPEGCPNGASEIITYCIPLVPILVAEGSIAVTSIDKVRLDKLAAELADRPDSQGYLIEYFPPKTSQQAVDAKIQLVIRHLKKSVDEARITIVTEFYEKPFTRYYIVPPGAENPAP